MTHGVDPLRPLVHVGYPKAASTWLQTYVWSEESLGFHPLVPAADIRRLLVWPSELAFDPESARSWMLEMLRRTPDTCVPVVSEERLAGAAESGGYDAAAISRRIKAVVPGARILIVIRRQADVIASGWGQYVKYGGTEPLSRWLEPQVDPFSLVPRFDPRFYEFDLLHDAYVSLFGKDDVLVVAQEQLRQSAVEVVREIQRFAGSYNTAERLPSQSVNPRLDASVLQLVRLQNMFGRRPFGRPRTSLNPHPVRIAPFRWGLRGLAHASRTTPRLAQHMNARLRAQIDDYAQDRFVASNRRLRAATDLPLEELGYQV